MTYYVRWRKEKIWILVGWYWYWTNSLAGPDNIMWVSKFKDRINNFLCCSRSRGIISLLLSSRGHPIFLGSMWEPWCSTSILKALNRLLVDEWWTLTIQVDDLNIHGDSLDWDGLSLCHLKKLHFPSNTLFHIVTVEHAYCAGGVN